MPTPTSELIVLQYAYSETEGLDTNILQHQCNMAGLGVRRQAAHLATPSWPVNKQLLSPRRQRDEALARVTPIGCLLATCTIPARPL